MMEVGELQEEILWSSICVCFCLIIQVLQLTQLIIDKLDFIYLFIYFKFFLFLPFFAGPTGEKAVKTEKVRCLLFLGQVFGDD